jgi:Uncharacterized protein conserved in bacteria
MSSSDLKHKNVVFFDGICHLCNGFVDVVITRDPTHRYLFAPLQGSTAAQLLTAEDRLNLSTVIYYENGKIYRRSLAVLKILAGLGGVYSLFNLFRILPGPLRDWGYNIVAKNRYAWFGEREFCRLPQPEERAYLLP